MKKLLILAAILISGTAQAAPKEDPSKNLEISEIKSQIRDDYRQLAEDKEAGDEDAIREDQQVIAEDKARLREAYGRYGLKYRENSWQETDFYRQQERKGIELQPEKPVM